MKEVGPVLRMLAERILKQRVFRTFRVGGCMDSGNGVDALVNIAGNQTSTFLPAAHRYTD
jgi:hypothetical protein